MARKPNRKRRVVAVTLPPALVELLDAHAERLHCTRSAAVERMIERGLELLRADVEQHGAPAVASMLRPAPEEHTA